MGAVFAVFILLLLFEDAESFAGEIRTVNIFGIENIESFGQRYSTKCIV